jgi:predicted site-specific integrase-resolvase
MYTINEFSKLINVTKQTLRNWDKNQKLVPIKLNSKHRRYTDEHLLKIKGIKTSKRLNVIYCRESTKQQKSGLIGQESKIKEFCFKNGIQIDEVISEFGSALNYNRQGLQKLIKYFLTNSIEKLIIFYKDRLVRFGFEFFEKLARENNSEIIILDKSENKTEQQEFAEDLISIVHYFSMKLYGKRSYKNKIKKTEDNLREIKDEIIKN